MAASFIFAMAYRTNQKRQAHKELLQKRRDATFIAEYIRRMAPDTYDEAEKFLKALQQQYPTKKDCTKTHEFLVKTTNYEDIDHYYNRKRRSAQQNKKISTSTTDTSTTVVSTTFVDNMALEIPLMPKSVVSENTEPLETIPEEIYQQILNEITNDPVLKAIFDDVCTNQDQEDDTEFDNIVFDESITGDDVCTNQDQEDDTEFDNIVRFDESIRT